MDYYSATITETVSESRKQFGTYKERAAGMDQNDALQKAVASLFEKAQGATVSELASAVEKATEALKLPAELEKSKAEVRKLNQEESKLSYENATAKKRERFERIKEYTAWLPTGVALVTLAVTLIVQNSQFRQAEKAKAEAAEDAQWADAVKLIS